MAKGSQLTQLKSALSQAGLTPQSQNGKKRKRSGSVLDDKEKERRAAKLKEIQQKMNPFDVKVTKLKHDVGGRKIAGVVGRPAQSKQAGIEQRKKTLLKEFQERDRAGGIVDRRFGENDPSLSVEDKMLERFTRERQRTSKGAAFNLDDEEELTHYGQSLSKLDDFDHVGITLDDSDEDEGMIDKRTVQKSHFGGFEDESGDEDDEEPERKKTKAEVMAEVIAKSKEHKMLRQTQQEQDEELRHELDQELDSLRSLLYAPEASSSKAAEAETAGELETAVLKIDEKDQEYDQFVRELVFDKRAKPKNRTKTEEELALEEKEALEKAERRRIRRMNGEEGDSDDEEAVGKKGKARARGGDDLEDDFMDEDALDGGLGAGLGDADVGMEGSDENGDEDGDDDDDDEGDEEDGEDEDEEDEDGTGGIGFMVSDEGESGESDEEAEEHEELVKPSQKRASSKKQKSSPQELPFTFPCPSSHDDFLEIVENVRDVDVPTVVKRIRTLHHPSLAEDNKFRLQALTGVLLDHILYITSPPQPRFTLLSALIPHLYSLSKSYPIQSAEHFISKLTLMQKNLTRGLAHGVTSEESRTWPGLPELSLLRIVSIIWPTSDLNHAVVNPARLLMGSYLGLCRIRSMQDIASGLFLCTLFLQYEELSKRLVPEAINFLANVLLHLAPHGFKDVSNLPGGFPAPDFCTERLASLSIAGKKAKGLSINKPDLAAFFFADDHHSDEQSKVNLLGLAVDLVGKFADLYKGLDGFIELYQPLQDILQGITVASLPKDLQTKITSSKDVLGRLLKFTLEGRTPLRLQAHKPIPIPSYIPKFEQHSSNYLRNRDPDQERNEAAKLRAEYKQERKGAIRELRKDARFLASEQQKKQKEKDKAYADRMNKVMSSMESERAEQKALERERERDRKRSGRK